jgi:SnoaL-like domain
MRRPMDIQRISDEIEIAALLNKYARAVDTKDWTLFNRCSPKTPTSTTRRRD